MKYTTLGNSGIKVSRICMGGMSFGDPTNGYHTWTLNQDQTIEIIKMGLESGITFFDTAAAYQNGTSEIYMGNALNENTRRDDIVVATKFLPRTQHEIDQGITGQEHVEKLLDASLKRLNMDYVDLYIYHMWDYRTPLEEIMEGLDNVVKKGKTRAIGENLPLNIYRKKDYNKDTDLILKSVFLFLRGMENDKKTAKLGNGIVTFGKYYVRT